jgi:hypothetical protein
MQNWVVDSIRTTEAQEPFSSRLMQTKTVTCSWWGNTKLTWGQFNVLSSYLLGVYYADIPLSRITCWYALLCLVIQSWKTWWNHGGKNLSFCSLTNVYDFQLPESLVPTGFASWPCGRGSHVLPPMSAICHAQAQTWYGHIQSTCILFSSS